MCVDDENLWLSGGLSPYHPRSTKVSQSGHESLIVSDVNDYQQLGEGISAEMCSLRPE